MVLYSSWFWVTLQLFRSILTPGTGGHQSRMHGAHSTSKKTGSSGGASGMGAAAAAHTELLAEVTDQMRER